MTRAERLFLAGLGEALLPVLADRLEHQEALVADRLEEARGRRGPQARRASASQTASAASSENCPRRRRAAQEPPALVAEQVVAPFDRRAERALALRGVARAAVRSGSARSSRASSASGERSLVRAAASSIASGRPSSRAADRLDRRVRLDASRRLLGALDEERDRVGRASGSSGILVLAGDAQRRPAGREHAKARPRREELGNRRGRRQQVLEVVERAARARGHRTKPPRSSGAPIACAISDNTRSGSVERSEGDPEDTVREGADELGCDLEREPGLARAAGPGERDEPSFSSRAASSASSRSRPRSGLAATGRFVASSVRSGGNSASPSW